jgi:endoplasmic reticulum resident protein 44
LSKREYRGQRSAEAFLEFVQENTKNPVVEFEDLGDLNKLDEKRRYIIGYFESQESQKYKNFRKAATNLKDDCIFYAGFGATVERMHPPGHDIVAFRPNKARSNEDDESFTGNLDEYDEFSAWTVDKCSPLVREITFENAEELTEEGLPFLILFHHPDDNESIKEYNDLVSKELLVEKQNMNFLTADGIKFAHPLHHLGKSKEDLPLLAIDSFRHMYLFPKYEDMRIPGKVKQFLQDLYSGKLHREFHYGPDPEEEKEEEEDQKEESNEVKTDDENKDKPGHIPRTEEKKINSRTPGKSTDPPESTFVHLGPSKNRYTFKDEF